VIWVSALSYVLLLRQNFVSFLPFVGCRWMLVFPGVLRDFYFVFFFDRIGIVVMKLGVPEFHGKRDARVAEFCLLISSLVGSA